MDLLDSSTYEARINLLLEEWHVPGVVIALTQNDQVKSRAFGFASANSKVPMESDMLCNIASCSKSFTAALLGMTIADKQHADVRWTTPVSFILPGDFALFNRRDTEDVTLDDIISHRTGLAGHDHAVFGPQAREPDTPNTITKRLRYFKPNAPNRTTFQYNNLMYSVAAYVNQRLTGLSISDALRTKIFEPLGMTSSFVHVSSVPAHSRERLMIGSGWVEEIQDYKLVQPIDQPEGEGAGCIITSVHDHIQWIKALINKANPITPQLYKELARPRTIDNTWNNKRHPYTSPDLYAAGWWIRYYRGYEIIFHSGCDVGFGSFQFFLPDLKFGGVIHGNSEEASDLAPVFAYELIDQALGVPLAERPDWAVLLREEDPDAPSDDGEDTKAVQSNESQCHPLSAYVGTYWNPGYKGLTVTVRDEQLFVDATDRGYPFEMFFEHVSAQTIYKAKLKFCDVGSQVTIDAEFDIVQDEVVKLGLKFESDEPLIWFERQVDTRIAHMLDHLTFNKHEI